MSQLCAIVKQVNGHGHGHENGHGHGHGHGEHEFCVECSAHWGGACSGVQGVRVWGSSL